MFCGKNLVNGLFEVKRSGGGAQHKSAGVFLFKPHKLFDTLGSFTSAKYHQPGGKGVEGAGMADLYFRHRQFLFEKRP